MKKIFTEDEVTLSALQAHFLNSGFHVENPKETGFGVRSRNGLYIVIRIDEQRKYLGFYCYFDLDDKRSELDKLLLIQRYNYDIFLACFSLGKNAEDLIVSYVMSYELGLIAGQLMHVFRRFSGLLDNLVEDENDDKFIVFGKSEEEHQELTTSLEVSSTNSTEGITQ
jgi:hypothetical protein